MRALLTAAVGAAVGLSATVVAHAQLIQQDPVEALMVASNGRSEGLPLVEERLDVTVDGQFATTTLTQVWHNQTGSQTEGSYRLKAGLGTHVDGFSYWNGEQKIVGEVFEKQLANDVYNRVTQRRRDPGLLQQDGEGAFTFKVSPIAENEKKRIEMRWTKWLERTERTVRYHAPISRSDAAIVVAITGAVKNVSSPTHKVHVETTSNGVRVRADGARGKGELVLEWEVDAPDWQPVAYVQAGNDKVDGWFATALAAPKLDDKAVAAKDVTLVIDRSGSMTGDAIEQAQAAAANLIRRLDARDRVNVISFSDEVDPLFMSPQLLDKDTRSRAIKFAEALRPGGGTDIALALKTAIADQDRKSERPRVIIFMTDGQSEAEAALEAAKADIGDARVFTMGLGQEVNRALLQRIAATKRGRFVYVDSPASLDSETAKLATSIARPVLVNVSVEVSGAQGVRLYPRTIPDLFADDELLVTGRLRGTGKATFTFKGTLAGKQVAYSREVDLGKAPARPWVGRLWAQARIDHLQEELALKAEQPELKNELIDLALTYNVVTPYTAFLAIPASELGEMAGVVADARARKAKIVAGNEDALALRDADKAAATTDPAAYAVAPRQFADVSPGDADDSDGYDEESRSVSAATPGKVHGHGCAGCASTGGDRGSLAMLVVVVGLVLRRRRRVA